MTPPKVKLDVPAIALSESAAAAALDVGLSFFRDEIKPDLRSIRRKSKVLYPVAELQRWAIENAETVL